MQALVQVEPNQVKITIHRKVIKIHSFVTASQMEEPSTSAAACHKELTTAIEDNRKKLLEILDKIEDLKK